MEVLGLFGSPVWLDVYVLPSLAGILMEMVVCREASRRRFCDLNMDQQT